MFNEHENKYDIPDGLFLDVAKEIKYETETDSLEDPTWVSKYGMSTFFGGHNMKIRYYWKEIRLQVIDEAIKQLELKLASNSSSIN
jgi:hypothetical protein